MMALRSIPRCGAAAEGEPRRRRRGARRRRASGDRGRRVPGRGGPPGPRARSSLGEAPAIDHVAATRAEVVASSACIAASRWMDAPRAGRRSSTSASTVSGARWRIRCTSRQMTLPLPSPDGVERSLAVIEAGEDTNSSTEAVTADALHGLADVRRRALADPVFAGRGVEAPEELLRRRLALAIERARDAHHQRGGRLGLDAQVREHRLHELVVDEPPLERRAVTRVVDGVGHGVEAHHGGGDERRDVAAGMVHHLDDGRHPARPSSPTRCATRAVVFDLRRCIAERLPSLVFEALDQGNLFPLAVREDTRQEEARGGRPRSGASVRKTSDIGAAQNHLWPVSTYGSPTPRAPSGVARVVLVRTSEPPLLLRHRHAGEASRLVAAAHEARVVPVRREARDPLGGEPRRGGERRHTGRRHRDRAAVARVDRRREA